MAINETKIIVKAVDEATPVFNKITGSAKGVGTAMDEVSRKAGGLTNYIKEQRKEGRQHSFIIGEMKDTLAVAGLAMNMLGSSAGKGSEQFKKINDSISKSIVVFMGLDAVVSGLSKVFKSFGGWVGMAITVIGAITFGLLDYFDSSKKVEEQNKRTEESFKDLTEGVEALNNKLKGTAEANKAFIEANLSIVESERNSYVERQKIVEEANRKIALSHRGVIGILIPLSDAEKAIRKEYEENKIKIGELNNKANILSSTLMGLGATVTADAVPSLKDLAKEAEKNEKEFWSLTRQMNQLLLVGGKISGIKFEIPKLPKVDVPEIDFMGKAIAGIEAESAEFELAMDSMGQAVNIFQGFSNNAFEERMNNYDRELNKLNQFYDLSAEKINADYNARIAAAQGNAELENALEEEKKAKLLKLEEEKAAAQLVIEDKVREEKRKNFVANQRAAMIQAVINGALAITKTTADAGFFGIPLIPFIAAMTAAQVALIASQPIPNFHTGGGMFFNAPANQETPVMVRGQETIRVTTPQQERNRNGGGITINFNSPVSDVEFVKNSIKKVLKNTGLAVDKAFVNNRNKLSFA